MRTIEDINKQALDTLPIDHLIHGEIMNEIVNVQEEMEDDSLNNPQKMSYLNGRLDALLGVYSLLNDIIWHKEKLEKSNNCLECNKPMWAEGRIDDDIKLCHLCYEIKYSRKDI